MDFTYHIPMRFEVFNSNIHHTFTIKDLLLNKPTKIMYEDRFLSCHWEKNLVDFYIDGNSEKQHWVIEKDNEYPGVFFIKTIFKRGNDICYLGAPNQDGIVRLYTSRNKYTMWKIKPTNGLQFTNASYNIIYCGAKFDKNDISLVIARYKEDLDWVSAYKDIAIVYNKGSKLAQNGLRVINIENLGREGHTYLYHIINNYESLTNRVIFSQGDPFEHNETILYGIDNYEKGADLQPLGIRWLRSNNIPPIDIENKYKIITNYGLNYMTIQLDNNLISSEFYDHGMSELNINYRRDHNEDPAKPIVSITNDFLTRASFPLSTEIKTVTFTYSALFSVIQSKIIKNDIVLYENLLNELISIHENGGANGYVLEKLWLIIFGN